MKKRGLIFVFVLLSFVSFSIFLSNFVDSANTCSNLNQEIMSISGTSNAFGEAWDENTYNEQICYNTIIGTEYFPTSLGFRNCQYEQVLIDGLENYAINNYFITLDNEGKAYVAPALTGRPPADVNDDWEINGLDFQNVINCALGICQNGINGDINGDGVTNAFDIQISINCVLGMKNDYCNPPAPQPYPETTKTSGNSNLDVDNNNKLNFKDVQTVISCAINDVELNNKFSCGFIDTDINNDGKTDVQDINLISEGILSAGGWQNICYGSLDCKTVPAGVTCSTLGTNYKNAIYLSSDALDVTKGGKFSKSLTLAYPATICCSQPGETSGIGPETSCVDRKDNNNNQRFDYADSTFCLASSCTIQGKMVKGPLGGTGVGAPWDMDIPNIYYDGDIANSGGEFAGCCSANSCYSGHPDVGGCKVNGETINVGGSIQSITCSVSENNAVWCKAGYENDGTGICVAVPERNCNDRIDNDGNGFFDYADEDCISSNSCQQVITPVRGGTDAGAPWPPPADIYRNEIIETGSGGEYAGCCPAKNCYSGLYPTGAGSTPSLVGCYSNGGTVVVGGTIGTITCSVSGDSVVWCKDGYVNDGDGKCVVENPACPDNSCEQPACLTPEENCPCTININTGDNCNEGLVCDPANLICKPIYPVCSAEGIWKEGAVLPDLACNYRGGSCCPSVNPNGQSLSCNLNTGNCEIKTCVDNSDCSGDTFCNDNDICQQEVPKCISGNWFESDGTTPAPLLACDYLGSANSCCPSGKTCGTDGICRDSGTTLPGGGDPISDSCAQFDEDSVKCVDSHFYSDELYENIENLNRAFAEANGLDYNFCTNVDANDADCGCQYSAGQCNEVVTLKSNSDTCVTTNVRLEDTTEVCGVNGVGEYYLKWDSVDPITGNPNSAIGCVNGARAFQCPSKVNLPFFTIFNLMISLVVVLGIYFLMRIERK